MELRIPATQLVRVSHQLLELAPDEGAAFLAVEPSGLNLVVRSARVFDRTELEEGEFGELSLTEAAQIDGLAEIKRGRHGLVEIHTHPGSSKKVLFSSFDNQQLPVFARYVRNKLPSRLFGAVVLGSEGYEGRSWTDLGVEPLVINAVGERVGTPTWAVKSPKEECVNRKFDRQIRALGPDGQRAISALRVAVVGLGGTGSQIVQQLAHIGVGELILIDDDRVEASNLPRLAGATWWDALLKRRKSGVARRQVRRARRRVVVQTASDLRTRRALELLCVADLIVGCVDNDGARLVMSELAAAHLIPFLDIGVGIAHEDAEPVIGGRIGFFVPGGPCLACADGLDFAEAAEDLESQGERVIRLNRGYAKERNVEPALMPLNTVLAGLAMTEFLAYFTGIRSVVPFSRYNFMKNQIVVQNVSKDDDCVVCGPAHGMGDNHGILRYAVSD
jgi:molybdopterin/thiamine biosynthesis adenylyltransferase